MSGWERELGGWLRWSIATCRLSSEMKLGVLVVVRIGRGRVRVSVGAGSEAREGAERRAVRSPGQNKPKTHATLTKAHLAPVRTRSQLDTPTNTSKQPRRAARLNITFLNST